MRAADYLRIDGGFDGFYDFVGEINAYMRIPKNLTELGVANPDLEALTAAALADPCSNSNPVELNAENTRALFEACM